MKSILTLGLFIIASLFFTFPLFLQMNNMVSGFGLGDGFLYIWNAYNFWHQLLSAKNPFFTTIVLYPFGANLSFHDYSPLTNLLLGVFRGNLVIGMNVLILSSFALAGYSTFLLIKMATKNYLLSLIAGLAYGFSPVMFSYLAAEHYYYLFAAPYLPLGILFTLSFLQKKKLRDFILIIIIFWLIFFTSYYMLIVYTLMVVTIFLSNALIYFYKRKSPFSLKDFKIFFIALVGLIFLPVILLFLFVFNITDFQNFKASESFSANVCNADLLGYIIPNQSVPHLRNISSYLAINLGYLTRGDTPSYYLGIFYLILAVMAFVKFRKNNDISAVGIAGIVILLLSLGTRIQTGNHIFLDGIYTPFYWFSKIPFMGFIGCPLRFSIVVLLSVIFLSFFLINKIIKKYKLSNNFNCFILIILLLIEYGIPKIQFVSADMPEVYQVVAQARNHFTVLELPSGLTAGYGYFGFDFSIPGLNGKQMYWQSLYQKPRIGGYLSRISETTNQFFMTEPVISDIFRMTDYAGLPINKKYTKEEVNRFIKKFNIGYIIFSPNARQTKYLFSIEDLLKGFSYRKIFSGGYILLILDQA